VSSRKGNLKDNGEGGERGRQEFSGGRDVYVQLDVVRAKRFAVTRINSSLESGEKKIQSQTIGRSEILGGVKRVTGQ